MLSRSLAAVALALLSLADGAWAAGFSLSPIRLTVPARDVAGSITATNTGSGSIVLQASALAWLQKDGQEVREETRTLIVNPPIFKLAPGEQQLIRVASRTGPPATEELAFRLLISEIPTQDAPDTPNALRLTLAMDVPVYLEPRAAGSHLMEWRLEHSSGTRRLIAENKGTRHYRIQDVEFLAGGKVIQKNAAVVVLPRSWLAFKLPPDAGNAQSVLIKAQDEAGQPVEIDARAR